MRLGPSHPKLQQLLPQVSSCQLPLQAPLHLRLRRLLATPHRRPPPPAQLRRKRRPQQLYPAMPPVMMRRREAGAAAVPDLQPRKPTHGPKGDAPPTPPTLKYFVKLRLDYHGWQPRTLFWAP